MKFAGTDGGGGGQDGINFLEGLGELALNEGAHLLGASVVSVVVA